MMTGLRICSCWRRRALCAPRPRPLSFGASRCVQVCGFGQVWVGVGACMHMQCVCAGAPKKGYAAYTVGGRVTVCTHANRRQRKRRESAPPKPVWRSRIAVRLKKSSAEPGTQQNFGAAAQPVGQCRERRHCGRQLCGVGGRGPCHYRSCQGRGGLGGSGLVRRRGGWGRTRGRDVVQLE